MSGALRTALFRDPALRQAVRDRDADRCQYCDGGVRWGAGRAPDVGCYDLVDPEGPRALANIVVACGSCVQEKGGREPRQAGMELRGDRLALPSRPARSDSTRARPQERVGREAVNAAMATTTVPGELKATLEHLGLLYDVQAALHRARAAAEEQVMHRAGVLHAAGVMDEASLIALYGVVTAVGLPGFTKRWDASIGLQASRLPNLRTHLRHLERNAPNAPDGTWRGTWPLNGGPVPIDGIPVVYVLYDAESAPCYAGSSDHLKGRLQGHERDGKPFVRWTASRCSDREAAYRLEDRLLKESKPYLNKRAGR